MNTDKIFTQNIRLIQWISDRILNKYPQYRDHREDWMQESYIVALHAIPTWQPAKSKLSAYLSESLYRAFCRYVAKNCNTIRTPEGKEPRQRLSIDECFLSSNDINNTDYNDLLCIIAKVLKSKNERNYSIFIDHYVYDIQYKDIAQKHRMSVQRLCTICRRQVNILMKNKEFLQYVGKI